MSQIVKSNAKPNSSVQNYNRYSSDPSPSIKQERQQVIKPRTTLKEYKNFFRAKKEIPSRDALCATQQCIKEIVRLVSLAGAGNDYTSVNNVSRNKPEEAIVAFDYNNPQMLDTQGIDQMHTYRRDEQGLQTKREYEIMKRELDKRRLVVVEKELFEQEVRDERFKLPDLYNIDIDPIYGEKETPEPLVVNEEQLKEEEFHPDVELFRTKDKPNNRAIIETETNRRVTSLQDRLMKCWEKERQAEEERKNIESKAKEELSFTLAQADFEQLFEEKKPEEIFVRPSDPPPARQYPNTFKELKSFRRKLNRNKREARDRCLVREKVFEELGKHTFCKEKLLHADDLSDDVDSISLQSSDGEDGLEMGYKNSREFLVRGIHDRFSNEPRGKFLNRGKDRSVKTCLNREEWIESTFRECERKKTLRKVRYVTNDITDEAYDIFHQKWRYQKPKNVKSPVKEYIQKGSRNILETFTKTKAPNFKPPSSVKVKNFNLTDFLYGSRKKIIKDDGKLYLEHEVAERNDLLEQLKKLEQEDKDRLEKVKRQRMKYLGFTCRKLQSMVTLLICL